MEINKKQRIIILVGLIVIAFMFIFPPWVFRYPNNARSNAGYGFILNPPTTGHGGRMVANLDGGRLLIQLLGVSILFSGIILLLSKRGSGIIIKDENEVFRDHPQHSATVHDVVGEAGEAIPEDEGTPTTDLPLRWFKFYTYVRIPVLILTAIGFIALIETNPTRGLFENRMFFVEAALIFMIILFAFLFYALHKRLPLGWRLNWIVLIGETILAPLGRIESGGAYLVAVILMCLVWFLPNYIYFKKRRHYFDEGCQHDKWWKPIILLLSLAVLVSGYYIWNSDAFQHLHARIDKRSITELSDQELLDIVFSDIDFARQAGYTDDQIATYLSTKYNLEVIEYLSKKAGQPAQKPLAEMSLDELDRLKYKLESQQLLDKANKR